MVKRDMEVVLRWKTCAIYRLIPFNERTPGSIGFAGALVALTTREKQMIVSG
jgi:hypothetical protein